jgi:hypothetical protein
MSSEQSFQPAPVFTFGSASEMAGRPDALEAAQLQAAGMDLDQVMESSSNTDPWTLASASDDLTKEQLQQGEALLALLQQRLPDSQEGRGAL